MSSRGMQMIKLAKMLLERSTDKDNVTSSKNNTINGENLEKNIESGNTSKPKPSDVNEWFIPNFASPVPHETRSSIHGCNIDIGLIESSDILIKKTNVPNPSIEMLQDSTSDGLALALCGSGSLNEMPEWENSDDSLKDPDFQLSSKSMDISSESDEEAVSPGVQFEKALHTPKVKNRQDQDTDFNLSSQSSENDEEMIRFGAQIENALATPKIRKTKNQKSLRQKLRNNGKPYQTLSGKNVKERICTPFGWCRKKCVERIPFENIKSLFNHYWSLGSYDHRILYIMAFVTIEAKKCDTLVNSNERKRNRENSAKYTLEFDGKLTDVCRKHFMQCFGETDGFLKTVIQKKIGCPLTPVQNLRGKHTSVTKISSSREEGVRQHISKFPAYESHYSRRDTAKKYLPASLSLMLMHRLYKGEVDNAVSLTKYSQIFRTMNLRFKAPKLDTCGTCDTFLSKIKLAQNETERKNLIEQKTLHLNKADMGYEQKRIDKAGAKNDKFVKAFAFDLQQCLPTPFLRNGVSFYKRQLWTFNLTVHDLETNKAKCFMWHEGIARRGGNEISSCIYKHLQIHAAESTKITFYSDSCSGQNKNSYVAAMFLEFLYKNPGVEYIDHKFLEPGHTHMECDSDHALIERKKKKTNVEIHVPRDWYQFVNAVGSQLEVIEMHSDDFYNFCGLSKSKFAWKRFNDDGERFTWNKVRWLRYTKCLGKILYKESLDINEPFKVLNIGKRGTVSIAEKDLQNINDVPCISQEKKKDLLDLRQFIHPEFHQFYENLLTNSDELNTHPDLTEMDMDKAEKEN